MFSSKRFLPVVAAIMLTCACMASFAGCGSDEPQSAKDVFERSVAADIDNCNMKGDIDVAVGVSGINMSMPIALDFDINGASTHGNFSMTLFGAEASGEVYVVEQDSKLLMYTKTDASGDMFGVPISSGESEWSVSEAEGTDTSSILSLAQALLENATFEKTDDGYLASVAGKDAYEAIQKIASQSEDGAAAALSEIPQEYSEFVDGLTLNFSFDKDCKLVGISIPETEAAVTAGGQAMDLVLSCDIAVSNHGQVAEIVVPDDVVNSAKAADDLVDASAIEGLADVAEESESDVSAEAGKAA